MLDFGSGSGIVGIATKRCGAATVVACDIDADTQPNLNEFDEFRTVRLFGYGAWVDEFASTASPGSASGESVAGS